MHGSSLAAAKGAVTTTGMSTGHDVRQDRRGRRARHPGADHGRPGGARRDLPRGQPADRDEPVHLPHRPPVATRRSAPSPAPTAPPLTGKGVSVGVIDSGVDPTHPFLQEPDGSSARGQQQQGALRPDRGALPGRQPAERRRHRHALARRPRHPRHRDRRRPADDAAPTDACCTAPPPAPRSSPSPPAPRSFIVGADTALNWVLENHAAPCGAGVPAAECPPIKVTNNSYGPSRRRRVRPELARPSSCSARWPPRGSSPCGPTATTAATAPRACRTRPAWTRPVA